MSSRFWVSLALLSVLFPSDFASAQTRSPRWNLGVQVSLLEYGLDYDFPADGNWAPSPSLRVRLFLLDHLFADATYLQIRERESLACPASGTGCSGQFTGDSEVFEAVVGTRFPVGLAEVSLGLSRGHFINRTFDRNTWGLQCTLGTMLSPRFGVLMEYRASRIEWREEEVGWNQAFGAGVELRVRKGSPGHQKIP